MTFDLTGRTLLSVRLDSSVLYLDLDLDWFVVIENDYEFSSPDGTVLRTDSGDEPQIVELLTAAIGTTLSSFRYTEAGHLAVGAADGVLRVAPSNAYESWHLVGPNKERVIATPGGKLAIWS